MLTWSERAIEGIETGMTFPSSASLWDGNAKRNSSGV